MLRPFRLLMLAVLAAIVYAGFFMVPGNDASETAFSPEVVATHEAAVWRAAVTHDEFAVFPSTVLMLREQHRMSWFRAAQASYHLARASSRFVDMQTRFERVLPDLEDAASVEQAWKAAAFDPVAAARAQLNWWVTNKVPMLNAKDDVAEVMAEEYAIRYGLRPGDALAATRFRAEAAKLRDASIDPDWNAIEQLLIESYRALRSALDQNRRRAPGA